VPGRVEGVSRSDLLAVAGMARARDIGRPVPQTLSITGFDDSPLAAPAGLTSAWVDYQQLGRGAAEHLMALIRGEPPPAFSPVPVELRVRASTAPPLAKPRRSR